MATKLANPTGLRPDAQVFRGALVTWAGRAVATVTHMAIDVLVTMGFGHQRGAIQR